MHKIAIVYGREDDYDNDFVAQSITDWVEVSPAEYAKLVNYHNVNLLGAPQGMTPRIILQPTHQFPTIHNILEQIEKKEQDARREQEKRKLATQQAQEAARLKREAKKADDERKLLANLAKKHPDVVQAFVK